MTITPEKYDVPAFHDPQASFHKKVLDSVMRGGPGETCPPQEQIDAALAWFGTALTQMREKYPRWRA